MKGQIVTFRWKAEELDPIRALVPVGMSLSEWVRRACARQVELERALSVERSKEEGEREVIGS